MSNEFQPSFSTEGESRVPHFEQAPDPVSATALVESALEQAARETATPHAFLETVQKKGLPYALAGMALLSPFALTSDSPAITFEDTGPHVVSPERTQEFRALEEWAEKHGYAIEHNIANGSGRYILHIGQTHNKIREDGLFVKNLKVIESQKDIEEVLLRLTKEGDVPIVYEEGADVPGPIDSFDFPSIREELRRISIEEDPAIRFSLLSESYKQLSDGKTVRKSALAQLNALFAEALPEGIEPAHFPFFEKGLVPSGEEGDPIGISYVAGAVSRLDAKGKVREYRVDDPEQGLRAKKIFLEDLPALSSRLEVFIETSLPKGARGPLLERLGTSTYVGRFDSLFPFLREYANTPEKQAALDALEKDARMIRAAFYDEREIHLVRRIAEEEKGAPRIAPLVYGWAHNLVHQTMEWNEKHDTLDNKFGLVSLYPKETPRQFFDGTSFSIRNATRNIGY